MGRNPWLEYNNWSMSYSEETKAIGNDRRKRKNDMQLNI